MDEADRLFELGLRLSLKKFWGHSTFETNIAIQRNIAKNVGGLRVRRVEGPEIGTTRHRHVKISENLRTAFFTMRLEEKPAALIYILRNVIPQEQQTIIFFATRFHVEYLNSILELAGLECSMIYGSMDTVARQNALLRFRKKKVNILLVTDVASRGIDIPLLDNTINYDFPTKSKIFVHRVGRVARQGRVGTAVSMVSTDEIP